MSLRTESRATIDALERPLQLLLDCDKGDSETETKEEGRLADERKCLALTALLGIALQCGSLRAILSVVNDMLGSTLSVLDVGDYLDQIVNHHGAAMQASLLPLANTEQLSVWEHNVAHRLSADGSALASDSSAGAMAADASAGKAPGSVECLNFRVVAPNGIPLYDRRPLVGGGEAGGDVPPKRIAQLGGETSLRATACLPRADGDVDLLVQTQTADGDDVEGWVVEEDHSVLYVGATTVDWVRPAVAALSSSAFLCLSDHRGLSKIGTGISGTIQDACYVCNPRVRLTAEQSLFTLGGRLFASECSGGPATETATTPRPDLKVLLRRKNSHIAGRGEEIAGGSSDATTGALGSASSTTPGAVAFEIDQATMRCRHPSGDTSQPRVSLRIPTSHMSLLANPRHVFSDGGRKLFILHLAAAASRTASPVPVPVPVPATTASARKGTAGGPGDETTATRTGRLELDIFTLADDCAKDCGDLEQLVHVAHVPLCSASLESHLVSMRAQMLAAQRSCCKAAAGQSWRTGSMSHEHPRDADGELFSGAAVLSLSDPREEEPDFGFTLALPVLLRGIHPGMGISPAGAQLVGKLVTREARRLACAIATLVVTRRGGPISSSLERERRDSADDAPPASLSTNADWTADVMERAVKRALPAQREIAHHACQEAVHRYNSVSLRRQLSDEGDSHNDLPGTPPRVSTAAAAQDLDGPAPTFGAQFGWTQMLGQLCSPSSSERVLPTAGFAAWFRGERHSPTGVTLQRVAAFVVAIAEYLATEILEFAGNMCPSLTLALQDICTAVGDDEELAQLFPDVAAGFSPADAAEDGEFEGEDLACGEGAASWELQEASELEQTDRLLFGVRPPGYLESLPPGGGGLPQSVVNEHMSLAGSRGGGLHHGITPSSSATMLSNVRCYAAGEHVVVFAPTSPTDGETGGENNEDTCRSAAAAPAALFRHCASFVFSSDTGEFIGRYSDCPATKPPDVKPTASQEGHPFSNGPSRGNPKPDSRDRDRDSGETQAGSSREPVFDPNALKTGDVIDCKDTVSNWCVAEILGVVQQDPQGRTRVIRVTYRDWSSKFDENIDVRSGRVAKFGCYTRDSASSGGGRRLDSGMKQLLTALHSARAKVHQQQRGSLGAIVEEIGGQATDMASIIPAVCCDEDEGLLWLYFWGQGDGARFSVRKLHCAPPSVVEDKTTPADGGFTGAAELNGTESIHGHIASTKAAAVVLHHVAHFARLENAGVERPAPSNAEASATTKAFRLESDVDTIDQLAKTMVSAHAALCLYGKQIDSDRSCPAALANLALTLHMLCSCLDILRFNWPQRASLSTVKSLMLDMLPGIPLRHLAAVPAPIRSRFCAAHRDTLMATLPALCPDPVSMPKLLDTVLLPVAELELGLDGAPGNGVILKSIADSLWQEKQRHEITGAAVASDLKFRRTPSANMWSPWPAVSIRVLLSCAGASSLLSSLVQRCVAETNRHLAGVSNNHENAATCEVGAVETVPVLSAALQLLAAFQRHLLSHSECRVRRGAPKARKPNAAAVSAASVQAAASLKLDSDIIATEQQQQRDASNNNGGGGGALVADLQAYVSCLLSACVDILRLATVALQSATNDGVSAPSSTPSTKPISTQRGGAKALIQRSLQRFGAVATALRSSVLGVAVPPLLAWLCTGDGAALDLNFSQEIQRLVQVLDTINRLAPNAEAADRAAVPLACCDPATMLTRLRHYEHGQGRKFDQMPMSKPLYRCIYAEGADVRDGIDISKSSKVRVLPVGAVIEAEQEAVTQDGIPRIKVKDGWLSKRIRGGNEEPIVERVWAATVNGIDTPSISSFVAEDQDGPLGGGRGWEAKTRLHWMLELEAMLAVAGSLSALSSIRRADKRAATGCARDGTDEMRGWLDSPLLAGGLSLRAHGSANGGAIKMPDHGASPSSRTVGFTAGAADEELTERLFLEQVIAGIGPASRWLDWSRTNMVGPRRLMIRRNATQALARAERAAVASLLRHCGLCTEAMCLVDYVENNHEDTGDDSEEIKRAKVLLRTIWDMAWDVVQWVQRRGTMINTWNQLRESWAAATTTEGDDLLGVEGAMIESANDEEAAQTAEQELEQFDRSLLEELCTMRQVPFRPAELNATIKQLVYDLKQDVQRVRASACEVRFVIQQQGREGIEEKSSEVAAAMLCKAPSLSVCYDRAADHVVERSRFLLQLRPACAAEAEQRGEMTSSGPFSSIASQTLSTPITALGSSAASTPTSSPRKPAARESMPSPTLRTCADDVAYDAQHSHRDDSGIIGGSTPPLPPAIRPNRVGSNIGIRVDGTADRDFKIELVAAQQQQAFRKLAMTRTLSGSNLNRHIDAGDASESDNDDPDDSNGNNRSQLGGVGDSTTALAIAGCKRWAHSVNIFLQGTNLGVSPSSLHAPLLAQQSLALSQLHGLNSIQVLLSNVNFDSVRMTLIIDVIQSISLGATMTDPAAHYLAGVRNCGPGLTMRIRKAFRGVLKRLVECACNETAHVAVRAAAARACLMPMEAADAITVLQSSLFPALCELHSRQENYQEAELLSSLQGAPEPMVSWDGCATNVRWYRIIRTGGALVREGSPLSSHKVGLVPNGTVICVTQALWFVGEDPMFNARGAMAASRGTPFKRVQIVFPPTWRGWVSDKPHLLAELDTSEPDVVEAKARYMPDPLDAPAQHLSLAGMAMHVLVGVAGMCLSWGNECFGETTTPRDFSALNQASATDRADTMWLLRSTVFKSIFKVLEGLAVRCRRRLQFEQHDLFRGAIIGGPSGAATATQHEDDEKEDVDEERESKVGEGLDPPTLHQNDETQDAERRVLERTFARDVDIAGRMITLLHHHCAASAMWSHLNQSRYVKILLELVSVSSVFTQALQRLLLRLLGQMLPLVDPDTLALAETEGASAECNLVPVFLLNTLGMTMFRSAWQCAIGSSAIAAGSAAIGATARGYAPDTALNAGQLPGQQQEGKIVETGDKQGQLDAESSANISAVAAAAQVESSRLLSCLCGQLKYPGMGGAGMYSAEPDLEAARVFDDRYTVDEHGNRIASKQFALYIHNARAVEVSQFIQSARSNIIAAIGRNESGGSLGWTARGWDNKADFETRLKASLERYSKGPVMRRSSRAACQLVAKRLAEKGLVTELLPPPHAELVGCRVTLQWAMGKWYDGLCTNFDAGDGNPGSEIHTIRYDDGEIRCYKMWEKTYSVISPAISKKELDAVRAGMDSASGGGDGPLAGDTRRPVSEDARNEQLSQVGCNTTYTANGPEAALASMSELTALLRLLLDPASGGAWPDVVRVALYDAMIVLPTLNLAHLPKPAPRDERLCGAWPFETAASVSMAESRAPPHEPYLPDFFGTRDVCEGRTAVHAWSRALAAGLVLGGCGEEPLRTGGSVRVRVGVGSNLSWWRGTVVQHDAGSPSVRVQQDHCAYKNIAIPPTVLHGEKGRSPSSTTGKSVPGEPAVEVMKSQIVTTDLVAPPGPSSFSLSKELVSSMVAFLAMPGRPNSVGTTGLPAVSATLPDIADVTTSTMQLVILRSLNWMVSQGGPAASRALLQASVQTTADNNGAQTNVSALSVLWKAANAGGDAISAVRRPAAMEVREFAQRKRCLDAFRAASERGKPTLGRDNSSPSNDRPSILSSKRSATSFVDNTAGKCRDNGYNSTARQRSGSKHGRYLQYRMVNAKNSPMNVRCRPSIDAPVIGTINLHAVVDVVLRRRVGGRTWLRLRAGTAGLPDSNNLWAISHAYTEDKSELLQLVGMCTNGNVVWKAPSAPDSSFNDMELSDSIALPRSFHLGCATNVMLCGAEGTCVQVMDPQALWRQEGGTPASQPQTLQRLPGASLSSSLAAALAASPFRSCAHNQGDARLVLIADAPAPLIVGGFYFEAMVDFVAQPELESGLSSGVESVEDGELAEAVDDSGGMEIGFWFGQPRMIVEEGGAGRPRSSRGGARPSLLQRQHESLTSLTQEGRGAALTWNSGSAASDDADGASVFWNTQTGIVTWIGRGSVELPPAPAGAIVGAGIDPSGGGRLYFTCNGERFDPSDGSGEEWLIDIDGMCEAGGAAMCNYFPAVGLLRGSHRVQANFGHQYAFSYTPPPPLLPPSLLTTRIQQLWLASNRVSQFGNTDAQAQRTGRSWLWGDAVSEAERRYQPRFRPPAVCTCSQLRNRALELLNVLPQCTEGQLYTCLVRNGGDENATVSWVFMNEGSDELENMRGDGSLGSSPAEEECIGRSHVRLDPPLMASATSALEAPRWLEHRCVSFADHIPTAAHAIRGPLVTAEPATATTALSNAAHVRGRVCVVRVSADDGAGSPSEVAMRNAQRAGAIGVLFIKLDDDVAAGASTEPTEPELGRESGDYPCESPPPFDSGDSAIPCACVTGHDARVVVETLADCSDAVLEELQGGDENEELEDGRDANDGLSRRFPTVWMSTGVTVEREVGRAAAAASSAAQAAQVEADAAERAAIMAALRAAESGADAAEVEAALGAGMAEAVAAAQRAAHAATAANFAVERAAEEEGFNEARAMLGFGDDEKCSRELIGEIRNDGARSSHVHLRSSALNAIQDGQLLPGMVDSEELAVDPAQLAQWLARVDAALRSRSIDIGQRRAIMAHLEAGDPDGIATMMLSMEHELLIPPRPKPVPVDVSSLRVGRGDPIAVPPAASGGLAALLGRRVVVANDLKDIMSGRAFAMQHGAVRQSGMRLSDTGGERYPLAWVGQMSRLRGSVARVVDVDYASSSRSHGSCADSAAPILLVEPVESDSGYLQRWWVPLTAVFSHGLLPPPIHAGNVAELCSYYAGGSVASALALIGDAVDENRDGNCDSALGYSSEDTARWDELIRAVSGPAGPRNNCVGSELCVAVVAMFFTSASHRSPTEWPGACDEVWQCHPHHLPPPTATASSFMSVLPSNTLAALARDCLRRLVAELEPPIDDSSLCAVQLVTHRTGGKFVASTAAEPVGDDDGGYRDAAPPGFARARVICVPGAVSLMVCFERHVLPRDVELRIYADCSCTKLLRRCLGSVSQGGGGGSAGHANGDETAVLDSWSPLVVPSDRLFWRLAPRDGFAVRAASSSQAQGGEGVSIPLGHLESVEYVFSVTAVTRLYLSGCWLSAALLTRLERPRFEGSSAAAVVGGKPILGMEHVFNGLVACSCVAGAAPPMKTPLHGLLTRFLRLRTTLTSKLALERLAPLLVETAERFAAEGGNFRLTDAAPPFSTFTQNLMELVAELRLRCGEQDRDRTASGEANRCLEDPHCPMLLPGSELWCKITAASMEAGGSISPPPFPNFVGQNESKAREEDTPGGEHRIIGDEIALQAARTSRASLCGQGDRGELQEPSVWLGRARPGPFTSFCAVVDALRAWRAELPFSANFVLASWRGVDLAEGTTTQGRDEDMEEAWLALAAEEAIEQQDLWGKKQDAQLVEWLNAMARAGLLPTGPALLHIPEHALALRDAISSTAGRRLRRPCVALGVTMMKGGSSEERGEDSLHGDILGECLGACTQRKENTKAPEIGTILEAPVALSDRTLWLRALVLIHLNQRLAEMLPLVDLSNPATEQGGVDSARNLVCMCRELIFTDVKLIFWQRTLDQTAFSAAPQRPKMAINRLQAAESAHAQSLSPSRPAGDGAHVTAQAPLADEPGASIFSQAVSQLRHVGAWRLRQATAAPHLGFEVSLVGERAQGEGGPYRAFFADICREVESANPLLVSATVDATLPPQGSTTALTATSADTLVSRDQQPHNSGSVPAVLLPTPNQAASEGSGRDRFVFVPAGSGDCDCIGETGRARGLGLSLSTSEAIEFLGRVLGVALRTRVLMPLHLPSAVWKPLCGQAEQLCAADLEAVDVQLAHGIVQSLPACASETEFAARWGGLLSWSTTFIVGRPHGNPCGAREQVTHSLLRDEMRRNRGGSPSGEDVPVRFNERREFAGALLDAHLQSGAPALQALRRGISAIVPSNCLQLLTWRELEQLVCGRPEIDVALLKRHTEYSGVSPDAPHIAWFWEILEELTHDERCNFIKFAWGQERLPASDDEFNQFPRTRMLIKGFARGGGDDGGNVDKYFPQADTCFFNVSLPAYSSKEAMRVKLATVLSMDAWGIDGDDVPLDGL